MCPYLRAGGFNVRLVRRTSHHVFGSDAKLVFVFIYLHVSLGDLSEHGLVSVVHVIAYFGFS